MKYKIYLPGFLFIIFAFFSCASTNKKSVKIPDWYIDLHSSFPEEKFIAKMGEGKSEIESIASAKAELALYFNTNVNKLVESDIYMESQKNSDKTEKTSSKREVSSKTTISTNLDFFALESTEAYYDKNEKKWFCVAYLDRQKSFDQYFPVVNDKRNLFYSIYNLESSHPIERMQILQKAKIAGNDFVDDLYNLSMISKPLTEKNFSKDRLLVSNIAGEIEKAKLDCSFLLNVPVDSSKMIYSSLSEILKNLGFNVTNSESNCFYILNAVVDYNRQDEDDLIVMNPSLVIEIMYNGKTFYVYSADFDKKISYNLSKIEKNVCKEIKEKIELEFQNDFCKNVGLEK